MPQLALVNARNVNYEINIKSYDMTPVTPSTIQEYLIEHKSISETYEITVEGNT